MAEVTEPEPDWLVQWRAGERPQQRPAQPPAQPRVAPAQGKGGGKVRSPAVAPAQPRSPYWQGFTEPLPEAWKWDDGKRREVVLDHDHNPPREVRKVGWNRCLRCGSPFWSTDVIAIRMCGGCKGTTPRDQPRPMR